jgi:purine-binding chemotaxis protein CheW
MEVPAVDKDKGTGKYLTFRIDNENYAVDVINILEIMVLEKITRVPLTPVYFRGIINVRGNVIPVMNLRLKMGMDETEDSINTSIIIVELIEGSKTYHFGIQADSVREVLDIAPGQIKLPGEMDFRSQNDYLSGIGRVKDDFVLILDVKSIFKDDLNSGGYISHDK